MEEIKMFSMRVPKHLWLFLKQRSVDKETSMARVIEEALTNYKKRCEKKLTDK
jgi:hypothetical protein